jgi:hypothetical protein
MKERRADVRSLLALPHVPHWYAAMESNEQLAFEEIRWSAQFDGVAPSLDAKRLQ